MLRTRVITALILVVCFLSAVHWLQPLSWSLLTLAAILIAAHEWSRLCAFEPPQEFAYLLSIAGCGVLVLFFLPPDSAARPAYYCATLFWFIAVPLWLFTGWKPVSKWTAAAAGALVLLPAWLAMVDLRAKGELWLLAAMALVWIADIAAYFAGRAFGRHKLAPAISPGKTWEGVLGAVVAVLLYTTLDRALAADQAARALARSLHETALQQPALLALACILCGISIVGDLFESALKRRAGVKDSGVLLPGHGGVLDRIDALLPVLPLAALIFAKNQYASA